MIHVAVYDTKPYDQKFLKQAVPAGRIHWHFHEFRLSAATALTARKCHAVCVFVNDTVDRDCLKILSRLGVRHIALRCAGFNNIDLPVARRLKFKISRVPAYSPHAVAEHAVGLLLTLNRKIHRAYNRVREHNFSLNGLMGFDIHKKTVGIVGTGKIGRIAAQIFKGFDARIIASDPFPDLPWARQTGVEYMPFHQLLAKCDIISLHLPLTPKSHHLLNRRSLARIKKGAVLINTSRGKLIHTRALIEALKSGAIGGVALDVYEEEEGVFFEDLSDKVLQDDDLSRLLTFPNVLITSHQAFLTQEALHEISRVTGKNILQANARRPLLEGTAL